MHQIPPAIDLTAPRVSALIFFFWGGKLQNFRLKFVRIPPFSMSIFRRLVSLFFRRLGPLLNRIMTNPPFSMSVFHRLGSPLYQQNGFVFFDELKFGSISSAAHHAVHLRRRIANFRPTGGRSVHRAGR
jgi:hypothetical protein